MLDGLKDTLGAAVKKLARSQGIDEDQIKALARDVQRALLQSDVNVRQVLEITGRLEKRALGEEPPPGLPRRDHVVKILYDELSGLLGPEQGLDIREGRQNTIVLLGIQGSGKTTAASKLARHLSRQGRSVGVVGADTHRPGALAQLRTMCERAGAEVYGEEGARDAPAIVRRGMDHFKPKGLDVVIVDTAGRHKEESGLLEEMGRISEAASPDVVLLVIDGTIGQQCRAQAEAFHKAVPVGGVIITKLDSSAKGGGALAASAATGARVMYVGTGERIDDLEAFSPTRFVGRMLGMGDVQAVLGLARRLEAESDEVRMKRITSGRMNMDDFMRQLEDVSKTGSLRGLLESMPGAPGGLKDDQVDKAEERIEKWRYIVQSMTGAEKSDPDLLNQSRVKRIARGSGWTEGDVKELVKGYKSSKSMMKAAKGRQMQGMLRRMGLG
ncbi:MAG: signal recognition particle receptor subunit alpha [Nitrosopumilus sp.]|nr:signal recognition particle receptor subunit alpha [Nitrosopumilus sp.]